MSPASYLTAPPRVAAKIVAPAGPRETAVTMAAMALLAWLALVFLVVALAVSITLAVVRGLRAYRALKAMSAAAGPAGERVSRTAAEAEGRVAALTGKAERLDTAVLRLQASLAQFEVLRAAAAEARATFDLRTILPRK